MKLKRILVSLAASIFGVLGVPVLTLAATTVVVTPANQQSWSTADTRPGGTVNFMVDNTSPLGAGALQLTTNATTAAKAQYLHGANTPLGDITDLGYYTKQNSASFAGGNASYQVIVNLNGTSGFTTLVYEPYQNGVVVPGDWQQWDVDTGQFWSSRTVVCTDEDGETTGGVIAGGGGAPFYTLAQLETSCPRAVVVGFGVNIGTNNPSYDVETDGVTFNDTTYDFEPELKPTSKDDCKNGGWQSFNSPAFKNQGDCVSSMAKAQNRSNGGNPVQVMLNFLSGLL